MARWPAAKAIKNGQVLPTEAMQAGGRKRGGPGRLLLGEGGAGERLGCRTPTHPWQQNAAPLMQETRTRRETQGSPEITLHPKMTPNTSFNAAKLPSPTWSQPSSGTQLTPARGQEHAGQQRLASVTGRAWPPGSKGTVQPGSDPPLSLISAPSSRHWAHTPVKQEACGVERLTAQPPDQTAD